MSDQKSGGRIIKVNADGWGFITSKEIEFTKIFFHWTELRQDTMKFPELEVGMHVEFTPLEVPMKGWRAVHIRVVEREKEASDEPVNVSPLPE